MKPAGYASGYNTPGQMASMYGAGSIHQHAGSYAGSVRAGAAGAGAAGGSGYLTPGYGYGSTVGFTGYGGYATPGGWATPAANREGSYGVAAGIPPDHMLESDVRAILAQADLSQITKKQIRLQLERKYQCSLVSKKEVLNGTIERVLAEAM